MSANIKQPVVYIMARRNGTLYVGVTSDLVQRVWQRKHDAVEGLTQTHYVHILVYFELFEDMESAIIREKRLKKWNRAWKLRLIEQVNPEWKDSYDTIVES